VVTPPSDAGTLSLPRASPSVGTALSILPDDPPVCLVLSVSISELLLPGTASDLGPLCLPVEIRLSDVSYLSAKD
jgi:hypothetical protein